MLWRKIGRRMESQGRLCFEKVTFEKDLRRVKNPTMWTSEESVIQAEEAASPRVPRQKHAWHRLHTSPGQAWRERERERGVREERERREGRERESKRERASESKRN